MVASRPQKVCLSCQFFVTKYIYRRRQQDYHYQALIQAIPP